MKSLNYAKSMEAIDKKVVKVIAHSRKLLLFVRGNVWVKKENRNFDVTMGSYDGAESYKLIGIYIMFEVVNSARKS